MELDSGRKEPPPSMVVLLLSARSAEPPHISGSFCARALITSPDALRVAISLPASKCGIKESQSEGNCCERTRDKVLARSGCAFFHESNFLSHCPRAAAPRSFTRRAWSSKFCGNAKCSTGFKPSSVLVAAISSAPSADPWDLAVPCAWGAGQAITVFNLIIVGCFRFAAACVIALSKLTKSTSPFERAGTSITSQP